MKALVLGGDGYCGWPISLRLSARGHDVVIVDNGSRRQIDDEIGAESLIPIASLEARIGAWRNANGAEIRSKSIDISVDFQGLIDLLGEFRPDVIIHLAEQRSVPYAMDSRAGGLYTMRNNLMGTTHLLEAMLATGSEAHLVHLGSIGVYGYETLGYEIPEGYQTVRRVMADGALAPAESILHPFNPVSKYHLTKALDHLCLAYYASAHGVRATDLHQGTVWGAETAETTLDPRLANRFDYDSVYGTVLNRYAVQAAMGLPLSVYGSGGQTRGFIHIEDVLHCIEAVVSSPPRAGETVQVVNEIAQTMQIKELAAMFAGVANVPIEHIETPRSEPVENELIASNERLRAFGITPTLISEESISQLIATVRPHIGEASLDHLYPKGAAIPVSKPAI